MRWGVLLLAGLACECGAAAATPKTDYRELVMEAMQAKEGTASAEIRGPVAEMIRDQTKRPNAKVVAEVTTVGSLPQEGCKRYNIRFTTPGTLFPTSDGKEKMFDMSMQINMCPNGMPPGIVGAVDADERGPAPR